MTGRCSLGRGSSPPCWEGGQPGTPRAQQGGRHYPHFAEKKLKISEFRKGKLFNTSQNETKLEKFNQKNF